MLSPLSEADGTILL